MPIEAGEQEGRRQQERQQRLRLVEDEEARLGSSPLGPAHAQVAVPTVLPVPDAPEDDRCHTQELEARRDGDQDAVGEAPGAESGVQRREERERDRPAGVDGGRIPGAELQQVERHEDRLREGEPEQEELPVVCDHVVSRSRRGPAAHRAGEGRRSRPPAGGSGHARPRRSASASRRAGPARRGW